MNKELQKLLKQINDKKNEVKSLVNDGKLDKAKAAKEELKELQNRFDLLYDLDEDEQGSIEDKVNKGTAKQVGGEKKVDKKNLVKAFVNIIKAGFLHREADEADVEVYKNALTSQIVRSRTCGCRDFYIAKITQNDATGYVAGTPVKLARAIKAKVDEKWTSEKIYSDDGTEEVINSYEGTEVELEVNALAPQDRQILFGQLYENGFLIKTADDKAPEVAVGWRERKLNGKYDFKWLYAGKFAEGISEEASTKEGKLSPTTKSIKGSFYERSLDNAYEISVDESNLVKENTKAALVAKILTDAGVEIDAEQTKTLVGCIAFDDISGALEVLREIGIAGAMFEELKIIIEEMRKGVPLGYFTSQWFGNFYLKALDHYIKEELHAEHYMRYMDDMVILGKSKKKLHKMHRAIETYLNDNLDLEIKGDWQVFRFEYPVMKDGKPVLDENRKQVTKGRMLDFMGFQFHHDRTTIRKSNIEAARRKANHISKQDKISWYNASVMLSYMGLFKHTDTYNYYIEYIKPKINVKKLKRIVSKHSRKENEQHDRLEKGDRNTAGTSGGNRQDIVSVNGLSA